MRQVLTTCWFLNNLKKIAPHSRLPPRLFHCKRCATSTPTQPVLIRPTTPSFHRVIALFLTNIPTPPPPDTHKCTFAPRQPSEIFVQWIKEINTLVILKVPPPEISFLLTLSVYVCTYTFLLISSLYVRIYTYNTHTHTHTHRRISRDLKMYLHKYSYSHIQKQSKDNSDF